MSEPAEAEHPTATSAQSRATASAAGGSGDLRRRERRRRSLPDRPQTRLIGPRGALAAGLTLLALAGAAGCGGSSSFSTTGSAPAAATATTTASQPAGADLLAGMPPPLDPKDVYAADRPGALAPAVRNFPSRIYVPNSESDTVSEIDPKSFEVTDTFAVDQLPQHIVPSYDLKTLWVTNDQGNTLTPIDPKSGKPGEPVPVTDPYNLYFTPDGKHAIAVAERLQRLDFLDPQTMTKQHDLSVNCPGVDHMDFTADGRYLLASCEFAGELVVVDVAKQKVVGQVSLGDSAGMPQDVKLSPDGRVFYVADMKAGGIWTIDAKSFKKTGFIPTGAGAHGLYVSRDSKYLYVSNRDAGSVSLFSFAHDKVVDTWQLPAGASPDMGGVSADGKVLWLSGRYDAVVYAIDTKSGKLIAQVPVGSGPHGLCVYPQPGRYSLGHTGVFR